MVHNLRVVHRRLDIGLSSTRRCSNDLLFAATVPLSRSTQSLDHSPAFDAASPKRSRSSRLYLHATPLHQPTGDPNFHAMRKLDLGPPSTRRCTSNYFLSPNCHSNDSLFLALAPHTSVAFPALDLRRCNNSASSNTSLGNPINCAQLIFLDLRSSGGALCGDSTIHPHIIC